MARRIAWLALALVELLGGADARALSVEKVVGGGRLVAYSPSGYDPATTVRLSARALRRDAESLYAVGFRAITTYATSRALAPICRFFKRRGFRTILVGIRDPRDPAEVRRAVRLERCADGYVVGSEGLASGRYTRVELEAAIRRVRDRTGRPVTTREPLQAYSDDPGLLRLGDWVFATIHPWYAEKRDPQDACGWTMLAYRDLAERVPAGVPTVIAETGLPTEGALATSEYFQRAFFLCLESRRVAFAHFEAFDEPWKHADAVGPHWGLFRADGSPKLWAAQQLQPGLAVERTERGLGGRVSGGPLEVLRVVVYVRGAQWEARPPLAVDRRGRWQVDVPADRPAVVYVATLAWAPPLAVDRLPAIDRLQILVQREVPPM